MDATAAAGPTRMLSLLLVLCLALMAGGLCLEKASTSTQSSWQLRPRSFTLGNMTAGAWRAANAAAQQSAATSDVLLSVLMLYSLPLLPPAASSWASGIWQCDAVLDNPSFLKKKTFVTAFSLTLLH